MRQNSLIKQKGAAIIVALFVMALVATCAVAMMFRLNVDMHRTELILNADNANLYAQGSIDWAIEQLKFDLINKKPNQLIDHLPITSQTDSINGFAITSTIEDMQNTFNLNDLEDTKQQTRFKRLVHLLIPNMNLAVIDQMTKAIVDWISIRNKDSKLAEYYLKQAYPYQAPHKPMVSVSELRLVQGITPQIYQTLLPYVGAMPQGTKLNVNDTLWPVLYSMGPLMTPRAAETIQRRCQQQPFVTTKDFLNFDIVKNSQLTGDAIDVNSSYFLLKTSVKVGEQQIMLFTMLQRTVKNKDPDVKIIWQSKGTL